jgi:hypothetical protein
MILPYLAIALLALATLYSAFVSFRGSKDTAPSWIFPTETPRSMRLTLGTVGLILLFGAGVWLGLGAHRDTGRASRFLIADGYTGWVRIEFEVSGAPPLPMEGGEYILRIPANGLLRTSSVEQYGWARDRYFFDSAQGLRPIPDSGEDAMIWGKLNAEAVEANGKRKYEEFFVGTEKQFKSQGKE